ncbi:RDD family protein [Streptomyces sp. NPDC088251]|uniref:RDD family protein n=1 Tax=Streptomyces sp. NPDC088251 TaxID=3365844 RepID=UPI0037F826CE
MSAPTPAPGDESPREGYYPDPSIPGYVRYWNGASWVPGTSRAAPQQGESMPSAPAGAAAEPQPQPSAAASAAADAPIDETGPVFLDEEPSADNRPEPATAWQADASRQTGFGGERDRRISWGGAGQPGRQDDEGPRGDRGGPSVPDAGQDPRRPAGRAPAGQVPANRLPAVRTPADRAPAVRTPADRAPADPRRPASPEPAGGALPGMRDGGSRTPEKTPENTVAIRGDRPGRATTARSTEQASADGTMAIRAVTPGAAAQTSPQTAPRPPAQTPAPAPNPAQAPGPGGGVTPWAQQVHQLAQPDPVALQQPQPQPRAQQPQQPQPQVQQPHLPYQSHQPHPQFGAQGGQPDQPVVPWKPPVDDPFAQLVQAQASARPAGLGKRFAARLVDTVVLGALVGAIGFPLLSRAMDHIDEKISAAKLSGETVTVWLVDSTTAGLFGGVLGAFLVLGVVLEALPTAKWGRTLGKKLCGLEVRDIESHGAPSFGAALRRWLVYGVLGVLVVGVANVLWCLFDRPWRQCWHDKAAHTFVAG